MIFAFSFGWILSSVPHGAFIAVAYGSTILITIGYLLLAVLAFFSTYYSYKFFVNLKRSLLSNNEGELAQAFDYLKSNYKFTGILTIIVLAFYAISIFFTLIAALVSWF